MLEERDKVPIIVEDYLSDFYHNSLCAHLHVSEKAMITRSNKTAGELLGCSPDELNSKAIFEIFTPEHQYQARRIWETGINGQSRISEELLVLRKDGGQIWVRAFMSPLSNPAGHSSQSLWTLLDITEYKKAEEALTESREFAANLLNNSGDPILVINPDTSIRYVNPAFERLTGFTAAELVGRKSPYPWWTEEKFNETARIWREAMRRGMKESERYFQKKNGEKFWVEINSTLVKDDGKLKYYLSNWADITERKKAETALRESEKRYRTLFEQSRDAIYITTREGKFIDANQSALDLFGYTKEELTRLYAKDLYVDSAERSKFQEDIEKTGSVVDYEVELLRKDRAELYCLLTSTVWRDSSGAILGYQGSIRDITGQKQAAQKLAVAQAQAMQSEKLAAIGRLAANIVHEVANPLAAMLMTCNFLLEAVDQQSPLRPDLEAIKEEVLHLRGIVNNLLEFARPSRGNLELVDANLVVQASVRLLRHRMIQQSVQLIEGYADGVLNVLVNKGQLREVFHNLITNALDAMSSGGQLTIRTKRVRRQAVIEFTDTGVGISLENVDRVFEPFFTTKRGTGGSGLGLTISYSIIANFRGKIDVVSQLGKSSTFTVRLPIGAGKEVK